ncbi:sodium- and chloride-dependent neutral and basic amino acid transporter B(0+)-like [Scyliorhinus canicula]|uniref:sodium- and chloride-dependent neutral and basic amino acid transporter B(0+)-like n=1 Tax=Scyliorhinus canicula TaxID=7830 RepID=UPI0018F550AB|nr:sodium- and chloride-dependent neutral and basic amino acid transporter B(0+)-like [Scyliorhinus canicula]
MVQNDFHLSGISQNDHQTHPPNVTAVTNEDVGKSDENVERGNWSSKTEYLLSMIGCAVGLGNVWRFPYLVYKNGGGAFLIPYTLMLALAGMPMLFLEASFGQFASLGPLAMWKAVPMLQEFPPRQETRGSAAPVKPSRKLKGLGWVWTECGGNFSPCSNICFPSLLCYLLFQVAEVTAFNFEKMKFQNQPMTMWNKDPLCNLTLDDGYFEIVNTTWLHGNNETCPNGSGIYVPHQGPSEQYWDKVVLRRARSMDETGEIVWYLALCQLLVWLMVGAALSKGVKSSGKVVYFTATFPYVILTILLIRGLTLEGAYKGLEFYIGSQSDFSKLTDAQVWKDAATQIFFTLSLGSGSSITLSSYNKFHNNCYRDIIIVCVVNYATSVLAGFAIFSVLGHMAHVQDKHVSEIAHSGFGLAFIVYPEALAQLPWAAFLSFLFFFMLLTLGLDSQFATLETLVTILLDQFPKFLRSKRFYLTAAVCLTSYILGLVCLTQAGIYWLSLIDHFCAGLVLIISALLEIIGLCWIYGVNRFIKDIEMMIGKRTWLFWLWWRVCWIFISPCLLAVILIWSLAVFSTPTYGSIEHPLWATVLGWLMAIFCFMWIPIVAIVRTFQAQGSTLYKKISAACKSAPDWGPSLEQNRGERYRNSRMRLLASPEM